MNIPKRFTWRDKQTNGFKKYVIDKYNQQKQMFEKTFWKYVISHLTFNLTIGCFVNLVKHKWAFFMEIRK